MICYEIIILQHWNLAVCCSLLEQIHLMTSFNGSLKDKKGILCNILQLRT